LRTAVKFEVTLKSLDLTSAALCRDHFPMRIRRELVNLFVVLGLSVSALHAVAQATRSIKLAQLEAMFADMRAKAPWNVDGPLLWGYFFVDPSGEKLKLAGSELEADGYRIVGLQPRKNKEGLQYFQLHVERVEVHSPSSLHLRNKAFYDLADKHGLKSYDGMDVGPVPALAK
jgi:hypothetical protein